MTWQTKKLGEICDIQTGKWDANHATKNGKYRFYTCAKEYAHCDTKRFSGESLILPGNGVNVGEVFYYDGDFDAYQRTYVINNIKILPTYLYYHLLCFWKDRNLNKQFGSATNFLKIGNFLNYEISYPESLPEQRRIVKILDEVFEKTAKAKENAEKNLQNSRELFESYLKGIFANPGKDWKEKKLSDLCDTSAGGTPLKAHKDYYEGGEIPWLRSGEVNKKDITESELFITEKGLNNSSAKLFPKDTVLIAMYGATAGQVGILRFKSTTNQAVCGILPNINFLPEFLYYVFLSKERELVAQAVGGAQPNISQEKIRNTYISDMELADQKGIVKKLDALSEQTKKLEGIYKQKLADLEELKKAVLKKAFSGGL